MPSTDFALCALLRERIDDRKRASLSRFAKCRVADSLFIFGRYRLKSGDLLRSEESRKKRLRLMLPLERKVLPGIMSGKAITPFQRKSVLRSEEHTSELQSRQYLVCRLLL